MHLHRLNSVIFAFVVLLHFSRMRFPTCGSCFSFGEEPVCLSSSLCYLKLRLSASADPRPAPALLTTVTTGSVFMQIKRRQSFRGTEINIEFNDIDREMSRCSILGSIRTIQFLLICVVWNVSGVQLLRNMISSVNPIIILLMKFHAVVGNWRSKKVQKPKMLNLHKINNQPTKVSHVRNWKWRIFGIFSQ